MDWDAVDEELLAQVRELAFEMLQMDRQIAEADQRDDWPRMGDLIAVRDHLVHRRSELMREVWLAHQPHRNGVVERV
jgi:hypothetical protein